MRTPNRAALIALAAAGTWAAACSRSSTNEVRARTDAVSAPAVAAAPAAEPAPPPSASGIVGGAAGRVRNEGDFAAAKSAREQQVRPFDARTASTDSAGTSSAAQGPTLSTAMIIRTGTASVEVGKLDEAVTRVRQIAQQYGGYVANVQMQSGRDQLRTATLEVKIPAARFDEAVNALSPVGKVESVNVTAEDVGEEFVDVSARVANARRLEERLIALLAARTGKLEEVLNVERELARVREEIERYEGRLRYLRTRAAVSTLTVTLHEPPPLIGPNAGPNPIADAFRQAWRNFVDVVAGLIASLGVLIPLGAVVAGVVIAVRRFWPGAFTRRPKKDVSVGVTG